MTQPIAVSSAISLAAVVLLIIFYATFAIVSVIYKPGFLPFLFHSAISCPAPRITNSERNIFPSGNTFNSTGFVSCKMGFTQNGAAGVITCLATRNWSSFTCPRKNYVMGNN